MPKSRAMHRWIFTCTDDLNQFARCPAALYRLSLDRSKPCCGHAGVQATCRQRDGILKGTTSDDMLKSGATCHSSMLQVYSASVTATVSSMLGRCNLRCQLMQTVAR
jgi:hypothetical protein